MIGHLTLCSTVHEFFRWKIAPALIFILWFTTSFLFSRETRPENLSRIDSTEKWNYLNYLSYFHYIVKWISILVLIAKPFSNGTSFLSYSLILVVRYLVSICWYLSCMTSLESWLTAIWSPNTQSTCFIRFHTFLFAIGMQFLNE